MNTFLKTGEPRTDLGHVSSIVQLGDFFYISGVCGEGATLQEQAVSALFGMQDVLRQFNLRLDHVLKFNVCLQDLEDQEEFMKVFANFTEAPYPAMSLMEVSRLPGDARVMIDGQGVNTLRHEISMQEAYCEDCDA